MGHIFFSAEHLSAASQGLRMTNHSQMVRTEGHFVKCYGFWCCFLGTTFCSILFDRALFLITSFIL